MRSPTVGAKGARLIGTHVGRAFDVEILHDFAIASTLEGLHLSFTARDATGTAAVAALEGAQFVASLPGAALAVAGEHGPFLPSGGIPASELSTPNPIFEALELLARIQERTPVTVLVPDLTETTMADEYEWRQIVQVLATGHVEDRRLGTLTANMQGPVSQEHLGRRRYAFVRALRLETPLQTIEFGAERLYLADGVGVHGDGDNSRVQVTPSEGFRWQRYLLAGDGADIDKVPVQSAPIAASVDVSGRDV